MKCVPFFILMIGVFAIAALQLPFASGQGGASSRVPVLSPGVHNQVLSRERESPIRYAIAIPANYSQSRPVPLVLALHYGGNPAGAGSGVLNILVRPALAELGAIIVAPDSVEGSWTTPANDRAVNTLLDAVLNSYNIDRKKILVTGFSMGGEGTWHFASRYPDRFSAAVPVAGRPTPSSEGWRVPVLAVHSRNDEVVPFGPAETRIAELKGRGMRAEMIVLSGITHYETNRFVDGLRNAVPWLIETWSKS